MGTTNFQYGHGKDHVVPTQGVRTKAFEQEILKQVLREKAEKERQDQEMTQIRYFDTTTKGAFTKQDMSQNTLGKRVMKT